MKSKPIKVAGKLFRYDFNRAVVELLYKANDEAIREENEWKANHDGRPLYGIDETGYIVCATAGLNASNWKDKYAREEYLSGWANELDEEARYEAENFIRFELGGMKK